MSLAVCCYFRFLYIKISILLYGFFNRMYILSQPFVLYFCILMEDAIISEMENYIEYSREGGLETVILSLTQFVDSTR
jgi:hypothetical protein